MKRTVKRYKLKESVQAILILIIAFIFTFTVLLIQAERVDKIDNGQMTVQYNSER